MRSHRFLGGFAALAAGTTGLLAVTASPAQAACVPPQYCGPPYVVPVSRTAANEFIPGADAITSMSADGRFVAFSTSAPLVPEDTNAKQDVYRRDMETNTLVRVSTKADGGQANDLSIFPSISDDGRYVAFTSHATNLLGGLTIPGATHTQNVYRKDLATGVIVKVNTKADGSGGGPFLDPEASISKEARISANGRYVVFTSNQSGLVAPASGNPTEVYRKDVTTGAIVRASTLGSGLANGESFYPSLSADGRYVAFASRATTFASGGTDLNGMPDVYRKDLSLGTVVRVSVLQDGTELGRSFQPWINSDGRFVSFTTTTDETTTMGTVRRKDLVTGELAMVSASADGTPGVGLTGRSAISGDGEHVAFESGATTLVAGDTNAHQDVFVKNVTTGAIRRVSRTSSTQQAPLGGSIPSFSRDARYVAFWSSSPLIASDNNNGIDIYRTNIPLDV